MLDSLSVENLHASQNLSFELIECSYCGGLCRQDKEEREDARVKVESQTKLTKLFAVQRSARIDLVRELRSVCVNQKMIDSNKTVIIYKKLKYLWLCYVNC